MIRALQNTLIGVLVFALAVSTSGVAVHTFYCFCKKQEYVSLDYTAAVCDATGECASSAKATCCQKKKALAARNTHPEKDCGKRGAKLVKLHTPFLTVDKVKIPFPTIVQLLSNPTPGFRYYPYRNGSLCATALANKAPPPRSGKALLRFIQVSRC